MKRGIFVLLTLFLTLTACSNGPKEVADMAYTAEICDETFDGIFTGTVLEGVPDGEGTFTFENRKKSLTYTGQWKNGLPVGAGELEYKGYVLKYNDTEYMGTYSGEVENGIPCGEGAFDGEMRDVYLSYEGNWKNGVFSGEGYLEANEFSIDTNEGKKKYGVFKGDVKNGVPSGKGEFSSENANGVAWTYDGEWIGGKFNGDGLLKFERDDYFVQKGSFKDGVFTPTPEEFFIANGTNAKGAYTVTGNAKNFLADYPEIFMNNSIEGHDVKIDKDFKFSAFAKNQEQFGDSLITVNMRVIQIMEYDTWGTPSTLCLGIDGSGNYYYMNMLNDAENVNVNSWVKATLLPLDYFSYETVSNNYQWAMAAAAVSITR